MRYICSRSRQINRPDDILRTSRIWKKAGSVVLVDDNEAPHYLKHPDEFFEMTKGDYDAHLVRQEQSEKVVQEIGQQWAHLTLDELRKVHSQIGGEIHRRELTPKPVVTPEAVIAASSAPVVPSTTNPDTIAAAAERQAKILKAIGELDDKNPEDYAMAPRHMPRVGRVSEVAGFKVTQAEVLSALELSQKAKAA